MEKDIFAERASVRAFLPDEVPQHDIDMMLRAAIDAPSAGNCQPWHFYVVRNSELKRELSRCAYKQKFVYAAPVVIVVCAVPGRSMLRYFNRGRDLYCLQDTAAAIQSMLLCAVQQGLGTCWCGAFDEEDVSKVLSLPKKHRPVAIIPVGYSSAVPKKPKRIAVEKVVDYMD